MKLSGPHESSRVNGWFLTAGKSKGITEGREEKRLPEIPFDSRSINRTCGAGVTKL
jgi:hypothetical protein